MSVVVHVDLSHCVERLGYREKQKPIFPSHNSTKYGYLACMASLCNGCAIACASKMIEKIDVKPKIYTLTKMGLLNGKIEISETMINDLYKQITNDK